MSKVQLIVNTNFESRVIDLDVRVPEYESIIGVIRTDFDVDPEGTQRASDGIDPVVPLERINNLVGKLLTLADAMVADKDQRKAAKDLLTQIAWDWYRDLNAQPIEAWRKDRDALASVEKSPVPAGNPGK